MKRYVFALLVCWGACSLTAMGLTPQDKTLVEQLVKAYNDWRHGHYSDKENIRDDERYARQEAYYALAKSTAATAVKEYKSYDNSLVKALFAIEDNQVRSECIWQIIRNITLQDIGVNLKRDIVYNIMKTIVSAKDDVWFNKKAMFSTLLIRLPQKVYYNDDSIKLAEEFVLANKCNPLLYDFFDLTKYPKIREYLRGQMESLSYASKLDNIDERYAWYCSCVLARHGDKVSIEKIASIAKNAEMICREHSMAMAEICTGLAYTQQMKLIEMLFPMLRSNISHYYGEDCMPQKTQLAHEAAFALSFCIKGFPKITRWQDFTEKDKQQCIDWGNTHKNTIEIIDKGYPEYIEKTIGGFSWIN